jgi:hypothetical protein
MSADRTSPTDSLSKLWRIAVRRPDNLANGGQQARKQWLNPSVFGSGMRFARGVSRLLRPLKRNRFDNEMMR